MLCVARDKGEPCKNRAFKDYSLCADHLRKFAEHMNNPEKPFIEPIPAKPLDTKPINSKSGGRNRSERELAAAASYEAVA